MAPGDTRGKPGNGNEINPKSGKWVVNTRIAVRNPEEGLINHSYYGRASIDNSMLLLKLVR
jgi:hypothetical protein